MSDQTCDVTFTDESEDADPVEFQKEVLVQSARKAHTCCECREPIIVGDSYLRISYKFEGTVGVDRLCLPCNESKAEFEYHIFGGDFWGRMRETWEDGAHITACVQRLSTVRAKAHMLRQWRKWKKLE